MKSRYLVYGKAYEAYAGETTILGKYALSEYRLKNSSEKYGNIQISLKKIHCSRVKCLRLELKLLP